MINLLPHDEKKVIDREYRIRRAIVLLGGLIGCVCAALALLGVSLVLAWFKSNDSLAEIEAIKKDTAKEDAAVTLQLNTAREYVSILQQGTSTPIMLSEAVGYIVAQKSSGIAVSAVSYTLQGENTVSLSVQGLARNRKALSDFTEGLRKERGVVSLDVPVSNFAKDSNISFSFTMVAKNN
jgi:hypothetical protein